MVEDATSECRMYQMHRHMKSHISKEDGKKTVLIYQNSIVVANLNSLYGMINGQ